MTPEELILTALIFIAATLYSSVGHAGASGYLAAMALFGLAPETMRPTALALNVLVASLATYRYTRAGQNDIKLLIPFVVASIPAAFIGGMIHVPAAFYKPLIGIILLLSAFQLLRTANTSKQKDRKVQRPPLAASLATGAGLGLLAGLSGTGGGIFLSPLLLFMGWAPTRNVSGIAASFILVNSISGLLGNMSSLQALPSALPVWAGAVLLGGLIGTQLGTRTLTIPGIRIMLALVLVIAGGKMLLT
ncbi:MAG: sulfite exporter TauE/SafE family protein [Alphaproteobacteria bacterium]|nr:sulfite exporter TauE/SafE family protein [Alphaproteobacteria bacterium]